MITIVSCYISIAGEVGTMKRIKKPAPELASKLPDKAWAEKADLELASALSGREVKEIPFLKPGEGRK